MLYATCRKSYYAVDSSTNAYEDVGEARHLYCIWHDQILMVLFTNRPLRAAGLVSKHQDGSYVADVMQLRGIKPVRGSTKRGGAEALKQLLETARDHHITITPDGPRGPRHELKPGIVFLASHSGRKIVPTAFTCRRSWSIKGNWTDMLLPKPFTRITVVGGQPLEVPENLSREGLAEYLGKLTALMQDCEQKAKRLSQGESPEQVFAEEPRTTARIAA
jgi:lysophospholipid acyltransferase (LPLAT)-like uncharacterized protein